MSDDDRSPTRGSAWGLDTPRGEDWRDRALCAQVDVGEMFFPEKSGSVREAKRVCMGCEVRAACLDYALRTEQDFGVFGGLSERERHRMKRGLPLKKPSKAPPRRNANGHGWSCKCSACGRAA